MSSIITTSSFRFFVIIVFCALLVNSNESANIVDTSTLTSSSSSADAGSTDFPCAPPTIKSSDYSTWTNLERLQFSLCYDTNDTLLDLILNKTHQMSVGDACDSGDPMWSQIKPGIAHNDYFDEFHEDVLIPPELLLKKESPVIANVLNEIGFQTVHALLTSKSSTICDWIKPGDMPIECRDNECQCWEYVPKMINHYTVHFTVFKEQPKEPVSLEWNEETKKCSFPKDTKDCIVQPNEKVMGGYVIPCYNANDSCLIVGNDAPCTLRNSMDTIRGYNEYANNERERLVPFRLHYPIPCKCTNRTPHLGPLPSTGFTVANLITMHDLEAEDVAVQDFDLNTWIEEGRPPHVGSGQGKLKFGQQVNLIYCGWISWNCILVWWELFKGNPLQKEENFIISNF